ncbi:hypothetical protein [Caballeronia sp.]|jgi:hypothetical protein|uniref:hypothetical protein n=1 Tax=Caballeronia sp. TaxID=1931223 RepID=UPI0026165358|nr:hypothetical protein [Caballeronia sp.]
MSKNAMSKRVAYLFVAVVFGLCADAVSAGVVNDVPSCYLANHFKVPTTRLDQEFFLAIDQTTVFDDRLRAQIVDNALRSVRPASAYTVLDFSAFSQGRYTEVVTRGVVEAQFPEKNRDDVSERALRSFDACMGGQTAFAKKSIVATIQQIEAGATNDLAKSDILAALKDISDKIRTSPASDKVLFLASDMLENSSISSFYSRNAVRRIDAAAELKKATAAGLIADFGGARVYVLGAGLLTEDVKKTKVYRDPLTMAALKQFWSEYFKQSNANLVEFGEPALLGAVGTK